MLSQPRCKNSNLRFFPTLLDELDQIQGLFNNFCVNIENQDDIKKLLGGCFGKGTHSRNYPQFHKHAPIIRNRVYKNRNSYSNNCTQSVIVIPDSDSETELEDYFTNLEPKYHIDRSGIQEMLTLSLEEAFFLSCGLNCLCIKHEEKLLNNQELWNLFKETDRFFIVNYIIYYYLRTKNWIVKPGIKFGGDFLIYKKGPAFYHASYVVITHVVDNSYKSIDNLNKRSMSYVSLAGLNRLCETAGKELLICEIIWPNDLKYDDVTSEDLPKFIVKETIMKRWVPTQNR